MASGGEIITIHLGPYSNYIGAHLANLEHIELFGTSRTVSQSIYNEICDKFPHFCHMLPDVLFTSVNPRPGTIVSHSEYIYVPRAIYCDFDGAIPTETTQINVSRQLEQFYQQQNTYTSSYDPLSTYLTDIGLHSFEDTYQNNSVNNNSSSAQPTIASLTPQQRQQYFQQLLQPSPQHLYWYNALLPHFSPIEISPGSILLTAPSHVVGSKGDKWSDAQSFWSAITTSPSSQYNGLPFSEALTERIRVLAEACDQLQGFRVIFDDSTAWSGIAMQLLQNIRVDYPRATVITFGVSSPMSLNGSSKSTNLGNHNATSRDDYEYVQSSMNTVQQLAKNKKPTLNEEIFAYQTNLIPYAPYTAATQSQQRSISAHQLQSTILTSKMQRIFNKSLFIHQFMQLSDHYSYSALTFPLSKQLMSIFQTMLPGILAKVQFALKKDLSKIASPHTSLTSTQLQSFQRIESELSSSRNLQLLALSNQIPSLTFHFLTAPYFALSLFQICQPCIVGNITASSSSSSSSSKTSALRKTAAISSLATLCNSIRSSPSFPVSVLAYVSGKAIFSQWPEISSSFQLDALLDQAAITERSQQQTTKASTQHISSLLFPQLYTSTQDAPMMSASGTTNLSIARQGDDGNQHQQHSDHALASQLNALNTQLDAPSLSILSNMFDEKLITQQLLSEKMALWADQTDSFMLPQTISDQNQHHLSELFNICHDLQRSSVISVAKPLVVQFWDEPDEESVPMASSSSTTTAPTSAYSSMTSHTTTSGPSHMQRIAQQRKYRRAMAKSYFSMFGIQPYSTYLHVPTNSLCHSKLMTMPWQTRGLSSASLGALLSSSTSLLEFNATTTHDHNSFSLGDGSVSLGLEQLTSVRRLFQPYATLRNSPVDLLRQNFDSVTNQSIPLDFEAMAVTFVSSDMSSTFQAMVETIRQDSQHIKSAYSSAVESDDWEDVSNTLSFMKNDYAELNVEHWTE